jgi:CheY-like chemotaxis protein
MSTTHPQPLRVLVVDDQIAVGDSEAMLLQLWGYEVRVAYCGQVALELAQVYQPVIVLCDLGMPGMDGLSVARHLREQLGMKHAFLVAITAYGSPEDFASTHDAGFDEHLVKPVDPKVLHDLLHARESAAKRHANWEPVTRHPVLGPADPGCFQATPSGD